MASRVLKLLHSCSLQSYSYARLAQEPISSKIRCLQQLTTVSRFSTSQLLYEKNSVNERTMSQSVKDKNEKKSKHILLLEQGYVLIYKFRYAPLFSAVNKVKWHQLYLTLGSVPLALLCSSIGVLPTSTPFIVLIIGSTITSTLWIFAAILSRVVGAVLISPDNKSICISYVDNKGQRKDDVFPLTDLVPLSDLPVQKFTSYWWILLQRYAKPDEDDDHGPYKMFVHNFDIPDRKRFMEAFGSLV